MVDTSKSSSHEQQNAEVYIASIVEKWIGCSVEKNHKIALDDGVYIEPDLYSEKDRIVCEIFAHIGLLKSGQQHKISQDILKMLLLEKSQSVTYRKIIVVVDDKVEKYLNGKSFIAESIRQFGIELKRINLSEDLYNMILNAQERQIMINT